MERDDMKPSNNNYSTAIRRSSTKIGIFIALNNLVIAKSISTISSSSSGWTYRTPSLSSSHDELVSKIDWNALIALVRQCLGRETSLIRFL
jgi:hypothetical protein